MTAYQDFQCVLTFLLFAAWFHYTSTCMFYGIQLCLQPWLIQYLGPHPVFQLEMLKGASQVHETALNALQLIHIHSPCLLAWTVNAAAVYSWHIIQSVQSVLVVQEVNGPSP